MGAKVSRLASVMAAIAISSGCATWPATGEGGFAEHHLQDLWSLQAEGESGAHHALYLEFHNSKHHLDILVLRGARWCFPATVLQAEQRQDRVARQLVGELYADAATDLVTQHKILAELERRLDSVLAQAECILPEETSAKKLASSGGSGADVGIGVRVQLLALLNRDNQFATGSSVVNPKYAEHLASAANILLQFDTIRLTIVGYADVRGDAVLNQSLSLARAQAVAAQLTGAGVSSTRLQIIAAGERHPLYKGNDVATYLVNRAVVVSLQGDAQ